jgi:sulfane dehydrogenase subunit SoxC
MKSVKWLVRIEASAEEFDGHYVRKYRYHADAEEPDGSQVGAIAIRSLILSPSHGQSVPSGSVEMSGFAWSGNGEVEGVSTSCDGGKTSIEAEIDASAGSSEFAPVPWTSVHDLGSGEAIVVARAFDSSGAVQPLHSRWNRNGYANNVAVPVKFEVV